MGNWGCLNLLSAASLPITIVLLDDVGWDLLTRPKTPTIDALAEESVTFTKAWA